MIDDALECFDNAVKLQPDNVRARWASVMSQLALVHDAREGAEDSRGNFSDALATLDEWLDQSRVLEGANTVGMQQPFYLAYHEVNNRKLLSRYGDLCSRLTRSWQESEGIAPLLPLADEKLLRIGIVSGQIRYHSVWSAIVKGWLQHVDVERFAFYIFHTGTGKDAETAYAQTRAAYFAQAPKSMQEWVDAIVSQRLDVLIYPEIGMDPPTLKLASMRLAPVQVAAWGHPETSGLPTIDYFLSAEDFEPEGAQDNYREKLIALPHLGCCYEALPVSKSEIDLNELGIDSDHPVLICPGVPFKYGPQHDRLLIEIAKRSGRCQLVFFHHKRENLSARLEQRLEAAFKDAGMFFESYGLFLPWMKREAFYALLRKADVYLDTIGFSGFNSACSDRSVCRLSLWKVASCAADSRAAY
jgi:predicted O-linked N-acetylglucosamine transferase (SPINDLY family)